jgi:DNA-binding NarL/FixJ family response regulator
MVLALVREQQTNASGAGGLTSREAQVLTMLRKRRSTSDIALELGISPVTVRRHVSALVHKTGVPDRSALAGSDGLAPGLYERRNADRPHTLATEHT